MEFDVWSYMVIIEGPAQTIGQLLLELYENTKIDRSRWMVDHNTDSRKSYAKHLQRTGMTRRRQGVAMQDELMMRMVQLGCVRLRLDYHVFAKGA